MKNYMKQLFPVAALALTFSISSCVKDLEVEPIDPNLQTEITPEQLFNKCYANIGVAGNGGASGDCDIDGLDGGTTGYVRQMWNANELTSDESICGWGDEGIAEFCSNAYDASHPMLRGYYYRLYFGVTICNQYLTDYQDYDQTMAAEVRFLRALDYFLLMDAYGNVPFLTSVSSTPAEQYSRQQIYDFVESELLEIEPLLSDPKPKTSSDAGYGRVDRASAWLLLSRLYLNAEVYTGTPQWAKAAEYAKKVMNDSNYKLYTTAQNGWSAYRQLFMGDNGENGSSVEALFPILQDGKKTTSWGTTLFLMAGAQDANVRNYVPATRTVKDTNGNDKIEIRDTICGNGTTEAWGGNRCRPDLIAKFFPNGDAPHLPAYDMPEVAGDDRAIFDGTVCTRIEEKDDDGNVVNVKFEITERLLDNVDRSTFTNGYATCKFNNFKATGAAANSSQFPDTDFFFFRVAEAYLTFAEATARLNGGQATGEAADAINAIRSRAHATTKNRWTLDEICDEWSREFYFEGRRRMDLVRFGRFGGNNNYYWQWKGGVYNGTNFAATKNLFAIPNTDLTVNPNLVQNPGY